MTLASQKELGSLALSSTACEMFLVLKEHLHHMQGRLSSNLFELFWQKVASAIDKFVFQEVYLVHYFKMQLEVIISIFRD